MAGGQGGREVSGFHWEQDLTGESEATWGSPRGGLEEEHPGAEEKVGQRPTGVHVQVSMVLRPTGVNMQAGAMGVAGTGPRRVGGDKVT